MQPLVLFFFLLSPLSSFNLIRKSADAVWSPTHVKPISAAHKRLLPRFKQAEAHLVLAQKTLDQAWHRRVNLQVCSYHCEVKEGEEKPFHTLSTTQQKADTITQPDVDTNKATVKSVCFVSCSQDHRKMIWWQKQIYAPVWRGDKPDLYPDIYDTRTHQLWFTTQPVA